jgi:uncharacterized membrane protein YgcG
MSKKLNAILFLAIFLGSSGGVFANPYTENWEITSFNSDITINEDGSLNIVENIATDFTNEAHRGLERSIPFSYTSNRSVELEFVSATDEKGESWDNEVFKENGYFVAQMRDTKNEEMTGNANFILSYQARNIFNFFDTHDELYWNINGTQWPVSTQSANAIVHLPKSFKESELQFKCITGTYGEDETNCKFRILDDQTVEFVSTTSFLPYRGHTFVLGLPKGTITPPTTAEQIWMWLKNNPTVFLPFISFIIMFSLWHYKGRDEKTLKTTVIPHYKAPKNLSPTEVGTIIDEKLDPRDITATILDLAIRGYLKIHEVEKKGLFRESTDFEIEMIKPFKGGRAFEKYIFNGLFANNEKGKRIPISKLKNEFYRRVPRIRKLIMKDLIKGKYFPHNPATIRGIYMGVAVGIPTVAYNLLGYLQAMSMGFTGENVAVMTISYLLTTAIVGGFGNYMPRKTKLGAETYYELKGLYEYINTAEKDRMKFQAKNNILFEKLLPYAMAFGLVEKWTKSFSGLIKTDPSWYQSSSHLNSFDMIHFSRSIHRMTKNLTSNIRSQPGSRGGQGGWSGGSGFSGGFSGGGFGGGGGRGL